MPVAAISPLFAHLGSSRSGEGPCDFIAMASKGKPPPLSKEQVNGLLKCWGKHIRKVPGVLSLNTRSHRPRTSNQGRAAGSSMQEQGPGGIETF